MLRVLDARTGSYAEVRPARPGLLRVCGHVSRVGGGSDITAVRVLLVADLVARAAELRGLQALTVLMGLPGQVAAIERDAGALGIHPPVAHIRSHQPPTPLGGSIDVHVAANGVSLDTRQGGHLVSVGPAPRRGAGSRHAAAAGELLAEDGHDPLAVRLALMSFACHEPADLTADVLAGARETLGHWRHRVAEWAESPSRPMPARIAVTVRESFDSVDTVSALALLHGLTIDDSVPAGAKFETFAFADRILGLDLAREVGHPRS
jgi:hypothetical protein